MTYILWDDFKTIFPRDEPKWDTKRWFAFCIEDTIIWNDVMVEPYAEFLGDTQPTFESVMIDVDGDQKEAVLIKNKGQEYTVLCPNMITALFLSDPEVVERWEDEDKDGYLPAPGWKFDKTKQDFPRFYKEESDAGGNPYRIWGNGVKEQI